MIRISDYEVALWRTELDNSIEFRDKHFGEYKLQSKSKSGENIGYFENGLSDRSLVDYGFNEPYSIINLCYPIVKNIIPTLYSKNPHIMAIPKRREDETAAPYVSKMLNYYYDELEIKNTNHLVIFDAYVLGMGVCKIGYATQFGADIPDEQEKIRREKSKARQLSEKLGLVKPRKEEKPPQNVDLNEFIRTENPYIQWISPFDFTIDSTANSIYDANWVCHTVIKKLKEIKGNKKYSNTSKLEGSYPYDTKDIDRSQLEDFQIIRLHEIHYKTDQGVRILTLAEDGERTKAIYHEDSPYEMDGFQFEILTFNKHGHKLYPVSDMSIYKNLQDRINLTFDNILDQVDKFVSKIAYDENNVTEQGKRALRDGQIGSIVATNKDPRNVFYEIKLDQVKAELMGVIDKMVDIILVETGLTRAQLTGLTTAETATEAQIGQAGQNLRLSDKADQTNEFLSRQARKLWQVIKQFVDLEDIQLITGEGEIDDITGLSRYSWLPDIDSNMSDQLSKAELRFHIEMGSTNKPDLPILRKQLENLINIFGQEGFLMLLQQQGYKLELAEVIRMVLKLYPELLVEPGRILKPIGPQTQGMIQPQLPPGQGGQALGSLPQQTQAAAPNFADIASAAAGEKGGQVPSV